MSKFDIKFEKLKNWLSERENQNIKAEQIIRNDAPNGYCIDLDTLNEQQLNELNDLTQMENE